MKKVVFVKPTPTLNSNMNKKTLFLDDKKASVYKKDIVNQLNDIKNTLQKISGILNKMNLKKIFNDKSADLSTQCMKKCASQAQAALSLKENIEIKYREDLKDIVIQNLDNRISHLEDILSHFDQ